MRIGLTGHYASGKSTVSKMFEKLGASTLDTDVIAREIVEPGKTAYHQILDHFGNSILKADLTLDRKKLASIVFTNKEKLELLNSITHPIILKITLERSANKSKKFIINVPLLFQAGYDIYMDIIIIVTAQDELLIKRGAARDKSTEEDAKLRLISQNSINPYFKKADYIIDNSLSIENTKNQVIEIWNSLINTKK
jgi:dephospho-CoA kinase